LAGRLAEPLSSQDRRVLLSGQAAGEQAGEGALICSCFQVSEMRIRAAIAAGCRDSAALGAQLRCGTNCGSCVPELNRLISECGAPVANNPRDNAPDARKPVVQAEPMPQVAIIAKVQ
jgi:NAD(P)H-nitrite reductase large subunit